MNSANAVRLKAGDVDISGLVGRWLPDNRQLQQALATATRKTLRWASGAAVRAIRAETGLPADILRRRVNVYIRTSNGRSRLFFGLRPVSASHLSPRQGKDGVRTKGGGRFPGAFLVDMGDYDAVFSRVGKERHPLEYQRIFFHKQAEQVIRVDILPHWQDRFLKILEQELKWRTR